VEVTMARIYLNNDWKFTEHFDMDLLAADYDDSGMTDVRLPHTCKELPYHYFDEHEYQMISGYRKIINADEAWQGKKVLLTIDGAAHDSQVYVNGILVGEHHCGYTAFTMDISKSLEYGRPNILVVKVDSRENLNIPPFGFVIDYMTYGGIYRDVYIDVKNNSYIEDVFVSTKLAGKSMEEILVDDKPVGMKCSKSAVVSEITIKNPADGMVIRQSLRKKSEEEFSILGEIEVNADENFTITSETTCNITHMTGDVELWDTEHPVLYELKTELVQGGEVLDEQVVTFGYRKAAFHKDGFYLNGRKLKIRGLNRHQSYPYAGYAMPESMQKRDADILKYELGVNAVRTSHYPQSHYFLDRCDELGLLVFTELPGWQHIGDEEWKNQAVQNVADMIHQYRNHTSIILWGVRINESVDDDEFYTRTNAIAHECDNTRQTGGVRCYKKGNLLEDVFTYNDFVHTGRNKGCDKKADVTSDMDKPYLISEYNGHMYPSKAFDWEEHRAEHAIRHVNVLDSVAGEEDIAGSFGWCMFDYNTHKDFGSGDRICYHGVMDMFRNPKLAAVVYACQQEEHPVLELSSSMDIGEHPGCNRGDIYIFTNADSVRMYKNDTFIKEYAGSDSPYKNMAHGPILIDDYIGDALLENENMKGQQAEDVKSLLNEVAKVGLYNLSKYMYVKAGKLMLLYHMKMSDAVELYNRYVGDWGGESTVYRFEAIKNGEVVKTITKQPMKKIIIKADIDHSELVEKNTYDVAAIRINAVDEYNNILPYFNDVVSFETQGAIELIGPSVTSLHGGMGGAYIRTTGRAGSGKLIIRSAQAEDVNVEVDVRLEE
jgi:beta-galactosidase